MTINIFSQGKVPNKIKKNYDFCHYGGLAGPECLKDFWICFCLENKLESFPDWDTGWVQGVKCLEHRRGSSMRPKCSNVVAPADSLKLLLFGFYLGSYINYVITFRGQQERFCVYDKYTNLMKFRKMYNHYYYLVLKVQKVYHILHSRHHNILTCAAYSSVCRYLHAQFA